MEINPPVYAFGKEQLQTNLTRPFICANTWVAANEDSSPAITLRWDKVQTIRIVVLHFDVDDHAMESVQFGHFDRAMPFLRKIIQTDRCGGRSSGRSGRQPPWTC